MVGIVFNNGASTVTSYDVNYVFNGGSVVTNTISAVSIAPFTTGTFTATTPVTMPTALGGYPVRMWVSLTGDANHANDTSGTDTLTTVSFMPTKKLAIEEGTGTWCGWCVRGIVYMDSLKKLYGNAASLIAVHNGDPMTNTAYDTWLGTQISGYPSVVIDRTFTDDPSNLLDIYSRMHNNFGFADITAAATVTSTSVSVAATVKPALNLAGGYHLVLVLTEDQVHGTGTTWNQHNYYSYMSTNQDLWFEGVNYKTLADPIPAASMYYSHVARTITPSATGTSSSALPSAMTAGTSYPLTLNATVAAAWNLNNMHAIVMLIEDATGRVLNTQNADLTLGVENVNTNLTGAAIYPNPAGNVANIVFNLQNDTKVNVEISDVTGRIVSVVPEAAFAAGAQHITVNTTDLAPGVYNVKVNTESGSLTQRLTIAK
jgi:thiol-disulfide isomerase/thioredoxin